jgi:hypothetical protein
MPRRWNDFLDIAGFSGMARLATSMTTRTTDIIVHIIALNRFTVRAAEY